MFDIGFLELVLVGIVALLVLGPERLPHAARMTGAFIGRLTRMAQSAKEEINREIDLMEMQQRIRQQIEEGMLKDINATVEETRRLVQAPSASSTPAEPVPTPTLPEPPAATDAPERPSAP